MTKRVVILGGGTGGTLTREPAADDHGAEVRVIERRPAAFRPSRALIPACPHPSGHCSLCRVKLRSGTVVKQSRARIRRSDVWTGHTSACTVFPVSDIEVQL